MNKVHHCRWCGAIIRRAVLDLVGNQPIVRWVHPPGRREVCDRLRECKTAREAVHIMRRKPTVQLALPFNGG